MKKTSVCIHTRLTAWVAVFCLLLTPGFLDAHDHPLTLVNQNNNPVKVAKGPDGKIYVSDSFNSSVFIYTSDLVLTSELKNLNQPLGVAVAPDGRMLVGSDGYNAILGYNSDGSPWGVFAEGLLSKPNDLALDFSNNLYVADSAANRISVFSPSGNLKFHFGSFGTNDGEFNFPSSVTVAYQTNTAGETVGELFVADQQNYRIQVFDLDGNFLRKFGSMVSGSFSYSWKGKFLTLQDVEIDDQYRVVTLDSYPSFGSSVSNAVQVLDAQNGTYIISFGQYGSGPSQVDLPLGMVLADQQSLSNTVILADNGNQVVKPLVSLGAQGEVLLSNTTVDENASPGTTVGYFTVSPAPGSTPTFLLVPGPGGADNSYFAVVGSNLVTSGDLNFETQATYSVRVKGLFSGATNLTLGTEFTINLADQNETPTGINLDNAYVLELQSPGALVGSLQALDEDLGATHTFSLVSGAGDTGNTNFSISGSNLLTAALLDYDLQTFHSVRIAAEDIGGLRVTNILTVLVVPVNPLGDGDRDNDGIPDWWEFDWTGDYTAMVAGVDLDLDGTDNLAEWLAATDPLNSGPPALNTFLVEVQDYDAAGAPILQWPSGENRAYDLEWAPALTDAFTPIASDVPATPPMNTYTDAVHAGVTTIFYRVNVRLAP